MTTNFEDLECWQRCNELKIYLKENVLLKLPKSERYELYSQILRASRSATANIAEGWGRYHYKENIKFLLNARGSVAEVRIRGKENRFNDSRIETRINDSRINELTNPELKDSPIINKK